MNNLALLRKTYPFKGKMVDDMKYFTGLMVYQLIQPRIFTP